MLLRFFVFTIVLVSVKAYPSRLKILPGLAFYRTDDGHDDSDNSLMDKDKDLLKSMWNIVDKMDNKVPGPTGLPMYQSSNINSHHEEPPSTARPPQIHRSAPMPSASPIVSSISGLSASAGGHSHGVNPGAKIPPLGTPITTINVYSTYPAATVKGETPFASTTYHHLPVMHDTNFASPFSAPKVQTTSGFESHKAPRNPYEQFSAQSGSPMFDTSGSPPQGQYPDGGMAPNYEASSEMNQGGYGVSNQEDMGNAYGISMENQAGSEPMQFIMPQHIQDIRPMGDMMQEYHNMGESSMSHMNY